MKETYYKFEEVEEEDKDNFELFTTDDGPICPNCGYVEKEPESIPYNEGDSIQHCGSCGKDFECDTYIQHSWTTCKVVKGGE